MKKTLPLLMAFVALVGILNCAFLEPVLASQAEAAVELSEDSDCCFICCSVHHHWITAQSYEFISLDLLSNQFALSNTSFNLDPPSRSIFHPPSAA